MSENRAKLGGTTDSYRRRLAVLGWSERLMNAQALRLSTLRPCRLAGGSWSGWSGPLGAYPRIARDCMPAMGRRVVPCFGTRLPANCALIPNYGVTPFKGGSGPSLNPRSHYCGRLRERNPSGSICSTPREGAATRVNSSRDEPVPSRQLCATQGLAAPV